MATMISEVYDALRDAQGVSDEKARKAAEAVASFEDRFHRIEQRMDAGFAASEVRFARIEGDMALLKWMVGGLYALMVPGLLVLLRVASKTGAFL